MVFKITKTEQTVKNRTLTVWSVNGIEIATTRKYYEYFCTIKNGTPSNIRDRVKVAKETDWNLLGLRQLFNVEHVLIGSPRRNPEAIFQDDYPDTTWGYSGSLLSKSKIKLTLEMFEKILAKEKESLHILKKVCNSGIESEVK